MKERLDEAAQCRVLNYIVCLKNPSHIGPGFVADLLQRLISQQDDRILRCVSHLDASRLIELANAHRTRPDFFRPSPSLQASEIRSHRQQVHAPIMPRSGVCVL